MVNAFRILSFVEGLSLIALFFIAMPAKHGFDIDLVRIVGPIHGLLWLAFLPMLEYVGRKGAWSKPFWNFALITSVLPFGCLFLEKRFRNNAVTKVCH
ncbi:MAG TPA: DUF3817 domain-containing protein [Mariprofundaceae bacterium]|nr:DUF3817 domain-containing protein [Mariprofundaceae bacterium]